MTFKMPPSFAIVSSLLGHIGTFSAVGFEVRKGDALYSEAQLRAAYDQGKAEQAAEIDRLKDCSKQLLDANIKNERLRDNVASDSVTIKAAAFEITKLRAENQHLKLSSQMLTNKCADLMQELADIKAQPVVAWKGCRDGMYFLTSSPTIADSERDLYCTPLIVAPKGDV